MAKFLVQYTHVEETTYEQWVEAEDAEDAVDKIEGSEDFETTVNVQGVEIKDYEVVEKY